MLKSTRSYERDRVIARGCPFKQELKSTRSYERDPVQAVRSISTQGLNPPALTSGIDLRVFPLRSSIMLKSTRSYERDQHDDDELPEIEELKSTRSYERDRTSLRYSSSTSRLKSTRSYERDQKFA